MTRILRTLLLSTMFAWSMASIAAPPIWDADFGANTGLQADDSEILMTLGFMFPFDGTDYDTVAIASNGGVMLGIDDTFAGDEYIDYDIWDLSEFVSDFSAVGNPIILPFNTDLDNGDGPVGAIHFKTDASTAVITWSGVATNANDTLAFITFQLTLSSDGVIIFGYNGINGDLGSDLDSGIVVGVSNGLDDTPPTGSNLSAAVNADVAAKTTYELWCYDENMVVEGSCFDQTGGRPDNSGFDLDQTNVIFTPNATGGFDLSTAIARVPNPRPAALLGSPVKFGGCTVGVADGTIDPTLPLLILISLFFIISRRKVEV